jgi:hypothetical protein
MWYNWTPWQVHYVVAADLLVASSIKIAGEVQDSTTQMGTTAATNMNPPNPQGGINNNINSNAGTTGMQLDQWRCRLQKAGLQHTSITPQHTDHRYANF